MNAKKDAECAAKRLVKRRRAPKLAPQLALRFKLAKDGSRRGGARAGAGRKPGPGPRPTPHHARPLHRAQHPVHVTLRVLDGLPSLRRRDLFSVIRQSIAATNQSECPRLGDRVFRIVHFSVQINHIHLVVEAEDKRTLSAGLTSLATRAARAINKARGCTGKVWGTRYFAQPMTAPRDVRNTLVYVLMNHSKHEAKRRGAREAQPQMGNWNAHRPFSAHRFAVDQCSSAPYFNGFAHEPGDEARWAGATRLPSPVHAAQTWLLAQGWRRRGLIRRGARDG